jgi:hypothetical protein
VAQARPVLISGATGLIGGRLARALAAQGVPVRALTRSPAAARARLPAGAEAVGWDGIRPPAGAAAGAAAVVHLAGEPVFAGRLSARRRERIRESRVASTRALAAVLRELAPAERPGLFVCASAVGYYGSRGEETLDESAPPGRGFLAEVCREWEAAAGEASGVRRVVLRIGIALAREGGALPRLLLPFRLGLGGRLGDGRQWLPWVHADDVVGLVLHALATPALEGALNATAPEPVRNAELARALGRALGRPALLPVPALALRAALGELAEELLASRRVVPLRALAAGYRFSFPDLPSALAAELGDAPAPR